MASHEKELKQFLNGLRKRNPHEEEFHQAVEEVAISVMPYYLDHADLRKAQILERLATCAKPVWTAAAVWNFFKPWL